MTAAVSPPTQTATPSRYRMVVDSPSEAVAILRKRFGERARVISVKTEEAQGLKRWFGKPRLELIVEIAPEKTSIVPPGPVSEPVIASIPSPDREDDAPAARRRLTEGRAVDLLENIGMERVLIERIRHETRSEDWCRLSSRDLMAKVSVWLQRQRASLPQRPLGRYRLFLGPCGSGKTTALCKALARDVFVHGHKPFVVKLDADQPNPTDGLAAFCDVLGVSLLRSLEEAAEVPAGELVYVDMPGFRVNATEETSTLLRGMTRWRDQSRVMTLNAAYEAEYLAQAFAAGSQLGATHLVFTHLEECARPAKLWKYLLNHDTTPLFFSTGPNLAGDWAEDAYASLLEMTFPMFRQSVSA